MEDQIREIRGAYGDIQSPGTFNEIAFHLVGLKKRKSTAEKGHYWIPLWTVAGLSLRNDVKDGRTLYLSSGINPIEIPTRRFLTRLDKSQTATLVKQIEQGNAAPEENRKGGSVIQLMHLENAAEVVIDGIPYLRLPVDSSVAELGCLVHSAGMIVATDKVRLEELK